MNAIHYIGLDVHKKTISYCIKSAAGEIVKEGTLAAERCVLRNWAESQPQPWHGAMETTIFRPGSTIRSSHMRRGWRWAIQRR
jgi:transposase